MKDNVCKPIPLIDMSLCIRKPKMWVPTRSDTNQAVQSQETARGFEILDLESIGIVLSV